MRREVWAALLLLLSCGSDPADVNGDGIADDIAIPNNVTVVAPTNPLGFVAGEVWDAATARPLSDATVMLFGGGLSGDATTDATGRFQFGPIAAGATFSLRIDRMGYVDAVVSGLTIDDEAGDFPTVNGAIFVGPIALVPSDGAYTVQVVSEDGGPVMGASVTVETAVRYFLDGAPRGTGHATGATDPDGRTTITGLPNIWKLPPRHEGVSSLLINVAPVDLDGDGTPDLSGATLDVPGSEARNQALVPTLVLRRPGDQPLAAIASNVAGLAGAPNTQPSIIGAGDSIRVVFNKPIDRDSVTVDMRDEDGSTAVPAAVVTGAFENSILIDPAEDLVSGAEYNLAVRVHSKDDVPTEVLSVASPFFAADDPNQAIVVLGSFVDRNNDGAWGTPGDTIELMVSTPVGRAGLSPAFRVEFLAALDFNGTATVGDGQGELPPSGFIPPAPLVLAASEPSPGNGAGLSGFTRFVAPYAAVLPAPLANAGTNVDMEVRFISDVNDGRLVTTASGRRAPPIFTGPLTLVRP
jgi:hypothetical protein